MKFGEKIVEGMFLERPNRYLARVEIDGKETWAHVPDPGRLPGLLLENRKIMLVYQPSEKRKTDYTLVLVKHGSIWVSVFPAFANSLVSNALIEERPLDLENEAAVRAAAEVLFLAPSLAA